MGQLESISAYATVVGSPESLGGAPFDPMPPRMLSVGSQIRHAKVLEIVEPLGEGGMGQVYRAYDPNMDRYVALKVLKPGMRPQEQARFHREALIAANFSHPNLVRVLEVGKHEDMAWLTMEYLRGRDIGDIITNRKAISFRVLVDIFAQALDALSYLHARGIAHCDIKPENIFVTRDPYDRRLVVVKVIDFGIARNVNSEDDVQQQISGDPRYMPPEQAVQFAKFDQRVDLYALGMTLYECVCRLHPFERRIEEGAHALLEAHRETPVPPPSLYMPSNTPPELASVFDDFIEVACAKEPDARFDNARAMKRVLERMIEYLD